MRWWFTRNREAELNTELQFHLQEVTEAKIAEGLSPEEARRRTLLEFGGSEQVKEECRDVQRLMLLDTAWANLKSALRFIKRSPGFALTIVLTLALGIGANSAVFSAIDAIVLRALPFPDPGELVVLHQHDITEKTPSNSVAPARLEDWNRLNSTFQSISGYYSSNASELSGPLPERMEEGLVAPRFFRTLGVTPQLGRDFLPEEEHFSGPHVAVISDRLWRRRFHGSAHVIGESLRFSNYSLPIVGVMPPRIPFPDRDVDFWVVSPPDAGYALRRDDTWFTVIGRLKPGVTLGQAYADLERVQTALGRAFPKTDKDLRPVIEPMQAVVVNGADRSLWLLFGAVSLLLLIACTNIATLLLARTAERSREIAIRYSLGASRASIILQLLTESLVLAVIGSALGIFVAWGATSIFRSLAKALPHSNEIVLDWRLMLYALCCAVVSTVLFGLIPAWQATRRTLASSLATGSRTEVRGGNPLQWTLVGIQVALAVTLLVGAGLLLRSFRAMSAVSPGFDASHVLTLQISAGWNETGNQKALSQRIERDLDAIRNVPGVLSAATSATFPGAADQYPEALTLSERESQIHKIVADNKIVSPGYFETLRIPVLHGASCTNETSWATAVVNRSFAESFSPDQNLIGTHINWASNPYGTAPAEIRGVVGDARENGITHAALPTVYWCANNPNMSPNFLVRTYGDPQSSARAIRLAIHKIEPARSVFDIVPLTQIISGAAAMNRLRTWLLSLFALLAVSLASIGLYGTLSYLVSLRGREVGLRIALGAVPQQILGIFLKQGLGVAMLGCVAGLALAVGLSKVLTGMLFDVSPTDSMSYITVAALVLIIAAIASVLPALRAARLDPMKALREE